MRQHRPCAIARTASSQQNFVAWWATSMWVCAVAYRHSSLIDQPFGGTVMMIDFGGTITMV